MKDISEDFNVSEMCASCGARWGLHTGYKCPNNKGMFRPLSKKTDCEFSVIAKIEQRKAAGLKKYGISVSDNPLTTKQWLIHAQEEALDLAIYLERLIQEHE